MCWQERTAHGKAQTLVCIASGSHCRTRESLFAGLESLYRPPERKCSPLGKDGLGAKDEFLDL